MRPCRFAARTQRAFAMGVSVHDGGYTYLPFANTCSPWARMFKYSNSDLSKFSRDVTRAVSLLTVVLREITST